MEISKSEPVIGEFVQIGRIDFTTKGAQVGETQVVSNDNNEVWFLFDGHFGVNKKANGWRNQGGIVGPFIVQGVSWTSRGNGVMWLEEGVIKKRLVCLW